VVVGPFGAWSLFGPFWAEHGAEGLIRALFLVSSFDDTAEFGPFEIGNPLYPSSLEQKAFSCERGLAYVLQKGGLSRGLRRHAL